MRFAARDEYENILCACHDIGKATEAWQKYILKTDNRGESPHPHATAGGLLSCFIILEHYGESALYPAFKALHTGAAHHGSITSIAINNLHKITCDSQARAFLMDAEQGIASLIPEISSSELESAWLKMKEASNIAGTQINRLNELFDDELTSEMRLDAFIESRELLGRIVEADRFSAEIQSNGIQNADFKEYLQKDFVARAMKSLPVSGEKHIYKLRSSLRESFLDELKKRDSIFSFIDAPTGLGKTETMLRGAELIIKKNPEIKKIVFAVTLLSVADQIFDDYLKTSDSSQIWNSRRKESGDSSKEEETSNFDDAAKLVFESNPFSESYNVTTFNQVLLAMCHPNRNRCMKSLRLASSVIIMDEFHKLPQVILPYFFKFAKRFAEKYNCRFILGSATPLESLDFWNLKESLKLPQEKALEIYSDTTVDRRRLYYNAGCLSIEELADKIEAFEIDEPDKNLLVVVNLIGDGSWPLRRRFNSEYNPWKELEQLKNASAGERIRVCLDGLVIPGIRAEIISETKRLMKEKSVSATFISTQMVEVGVDLDFDAAIIDYQGIASTIQRGGRVGREGRTVPCKVEVFNLVKEDTTSFRKLFDFQMKHDERLKFAAFSKLALKEKNFHAKEEEFFNKWGENELTDTELAHQLAEIQQTVFGKAQAPDIGKTLFTISCGDTSLGAGYENAQFIAELISNEKTENILIFESADQYANFKSIFDDVAENKSDMAKRAELRQIMSSNMISPSPAIVSELGLEFCAAFDLFGDTVKALVKKTNNIL